MNLLKYIVLTVMCLGIMTLASAQDAQQEKSMPTPEKAQPVTITKDASSTLQLKPKP